MDFPLKIYDVVDCEKDANVPKSENESKLELHARRVCWKSGCSRTPNLLPVCCLPETLRSCMSKSLGMTSSDRIAARSQALKFWLRRSLELPPTGRDWSTCSIDPDVEEFCARSVFAVWKEMLESINYPDIGVVEEFCDGATLTGPTLRQAYGRSNSHLRRWPRGAATASRCAEIWFVVFFNEKIAQSVWQQTLDEVTKGELEGPLPLAEIPLDIPLSKRFGVERGGKIRCVDDFSTSGINAAAQPLESPKPHTLDVVAGMLSTLMQLDLSGERWNIRSFDLKSAYRECAVHPRPCKYAVIVVDDPNTKTLQAFRLKALPFGSVKSVHFFFRVSHSIWAVLMTIFMVITMNY